MATVGPLVDQLQAHLRELESDPTTNIDEKLLQTCSLALPQYIAKDVSASIILQLSKILPALQTDPTAVIHFLILLLEPFDFSDILSLDTGIDFVAGLHVQALPYNRLMLALLNKATHNAADAATIAARPEVVAALVQLWLCTPDPGIAQEASSTLLALLKADQESPPGSGEDPVPAHNQGLMWKRVFGDQDIYALIFSTCSLQSSNDTLELSKSQKTLAQARLLEWLPVIGQLNWKAITNNHHPSVESQYVKGKGEGLLYFAAVCMVDIKDDVLMHRCLIDFYADLLQKVKHTEQASSIRSSVSLDFLVLHGLHEQALSFYLDPTNPHHDPLDLQFVYAPSANYLAAYASSYPEHFMESPVRGQTISRVKQSFDLSPSRWAHAESPRHDLHILASLPRLSLLPSPGQSTWSTTPLSMLPSKFTNPDVLDTLATIFHGPTNQEVLTFPPSKYSSTSMSPGEQVEAQTARMLYYLYLNHNVKLFEDLVKHADTVALESHALAAINVITSVATANWLPPPADSSDGPGSVPTENEFQSLLPHPPTATPNSGALALLAPPSLEHTLPYLLRPPRTFSNIVGGLGDSQNSAYKIAMAKFEALKALNSRLEDQVRQDPGQGYEEIVETLQKRIREGPWGRQGDIGTNVATLEL